MTSALDLLLLKDQELFLWLNGMHAPWADTLMYWVTFKYTWIPLYIFLIFITVKNEKRKSIVILLTIIVAVALADKITSGIMKPYFARLRPCHEPSLFGLIHEISGCGGTFGFASSHASTSFALAFTWFTLLKSRVRNMGWLFVWAALYAYSRVYVGVHYPLDIVVGMLVGLLSGWCSVQLYLIFLKKYYPN